MLRTYYRHSSCPLAGLLVMMMIGACSGSSDTNGGASDPTAFGQKYKLADSEIPGWKQTTDPTDSMPFGVYTAANLNNRIDGGNEAYISRGMRLAMYQDMTGPDPNICTVVAMDFGTDASAKAMFDYEKGLTGATTALPPYDVATAIGETLSTGVTVYAHIKASYFELLFDGYGADPSAAVPVATQFLQALAAKTK